jgi:hypothetical protein
MHDDVFVVFIIEVHNLSSLYWVISNGCEHVETDDADYVLLWCKI